MTDDSTLTLGGFAFLFLLGYLGWWVGGLIK